MLGASEIGGILDRELVGSRHRMAVLFGLSPPFGTYTATRHEEACTAARSAMLVFAVVETRGLTAVVAAGYEGPGSLGTFCPS